MTIPKPARMDLYQIIDANLNRCSEGLRVVEEIGRFILSDTTLQRSTKTLRQELSRLFSDKRYDVSKRVGFIASGRDSETDIGRSYSTSSEMERSTIEDVLKSNFSRSEESARVLEEFTKMIDGELSSKIKQFRFKLYTVEKRFIEKHLSQKKRGFLLTAGFYPIIDRALIGESDPVSIAKQILSAGVKIMMYQDRLSRDSEKYLVCVELAQICRRKKVDLIISGSVDIAFASEAAGVHLYQGDMPVNAARNILGPQAVIGTMAHNKTAIRRASKEDVDYIAVGPVFPGPGTTVRSVGVELISWARQNTPLPIIAMGGINMKNIRQVVAAKPNSIAVASGLFQAGKVSGQAALFLKRIQKSK
jgi:thiamine-phosphate pyrophosphorylase